MKTFKLFLSEMTSNPVNATFHWTINIDDTDPKETVKSEIEMASSGVKIVAIEDEYSDDYLQITISGQVTHLMDALSNVGFEDTVSFTVKNEIIDNVEIFLNQFSGSEDWAEIYFVDCTFKSHLLALTDGEYVIDFDWCIFGDASVSEKIADLLDKVKQGEIDEFDYQNQMIEAGFEKYL